MKLPLRSLASPQLIKPPCQVLPDCMPFTWRLRTRLLDNIANTVGQEYAKKTQKLHLVGRKNNKQAILRKFFFLSNSFLICFQMYCTPQFFLLPHCCDRAPVVAFLNEGWMTSLGALQRGFHDSLPQLSINKHLQLLTGLSEIFTGRAPRFCNNKRFRRVFYVSTSLWGMNYWSVYSKLLPHHDVSNSSTKLRYVGGHEEEASTTFFTNHLRDGAIRNEDYLSLGNIFGFSWSSEPGCCCTWFKSPFRETQTGEGVNDFIQIWKTTKNVKKGKKTSVTWRFSAADVETAETRRMVSILGWWHQCDLISLLSNIGVLSQVLSIIFYIRYPIIHLWISCIMESGPIQNLHEKGDA